MVTFSLILNEGMALPECSSFDSDGGFFLNTPKSAAFGILLALIPALTGCMRAAGDEAQTAEGARSTMSQDLSGTEVATLGGGCFWCVEAVYERIDGVVEVVSGYAGGHTINPTYEEVCSGKTGHAEVVQIHYDPDRIDYKKIVDLFWKAHDPTTPNRQGADVGTQYRSIILYESEEQKKIAEQSRSEASGQFERPVVTEIEPLDVFYEAEKYHQDYFDNNPFAGYCNFVIKPKLDKLGLLEQ
jgi:peptide-methionine (S)-S-oxide reductase